MMKKLTYILFTLAGVLAFNSCSDDDVVPGNPAMTPKTEFSAALYGDSLPFTVNVSDMDVPLSTLKAQLYYDEEMVSETVIRTKTSDDYSGKIFVPFYANVPSGRATLKLVLQNIHFTTTEKEYLVSLSRPDFPYLTFVTADGEYRMEREELYQYSVADDFPQKIKGYIKSPKVGENGNVLTFGLENGVITQGPLTDEITFSNSNAGNYSIHFNTYSYAASPFVKLMLNGKKMDMIDDDNFKLDLTLSAGQKLLFSGIPNFEKWWIDPSFFKKEEDNTTLSFLPIAGSYRIVVNFKHEYIYAEVLKDGEPATLQTDGSGAIWIIGNGIGKPSVAANQVGWVTEKALCMAPLGNGKYQTTVVAGQSMKADDIDFKFFHQKGWGGEFKNDALSTTSDLIFIGAGNDVNGRGEGNLGLIAGKSFDMMGIYTFTVDVSAGNTNAVLTVAKIGEEAPPAFEATFDGTALEMVGADTYKVEKTFTQGQTINVTGISDLGSWWIDPDFFTLQGNQLTFLPIAGKYRVTANTALKYFVVEGMIGDALATLQADGSGAVWVIGDGVGKPSVWENHVGWDTSKGLCMAPVGNKKYQLTVVAGQTVYTDYINFKFFHQKDWGGEFKNDVLSTTSDLVFIGAGDEVNGRGEGNLGLLEGVTLEDGAAYVFTLDLTQGNDNAKLTVTKK